MAFKSKMSLSLCTGISVLLHFPLHVHDHTPLTVGPIYSSSKLRTAQMMIFSLVAIIGLEKCCIISSYLQWLCHSGERAVAHGPLVYAYTLLFGFLAIIAVTIMYYFQAPIT